jgi:diguanylate cyclase (GGDEF)-like protein
MSRGDRRDRAATSGAVTPGASMPEPLLPHAAPLPSPRTSAARSTRPVATQPVTPAPARPLKSGGSAVPDVARRFSTPGERIEPALALALTATAGVVVWALEAPRAASIPLLALPAVAALALVAPAMRGGRLLRGLALLAAAAVAGLEAPALVPVTVLIVIATAAAYPGLLAAPASARVITLGSILALAVPLSGQLIQAGLAPTGDPLADLNDFFAGETEPEASATRLALVGGIAVVAVLGWAGLVNRRALAQTASLAESRARDVRLATAEAARTAARDVLTGLANRDALIRDATRALSQMAASGVGPARRALAVFEIDRFTTLVDSAGLDVADEVVRQLATRLRTASDPGSLVARSGRHEFAVLLGGETGEDAATVAARSMGTVFDVPVTIGGREFFVSCSIGVAVAGQGLETAEALLHAAQEAATVARQKGRSRIVTSDQALRAHSAGQARMEVELRDAVRHQQVGLAYQPVLALGGDERQDGVVAVEALARWTRADGSVVPPQRFIPLADELGLGVTLGLRLIDEALDRLVAWRHAGYAVDQVWLNLAPSQILDPEFAHLVSARLTARSVPATSLMVEVGVGTFVESDQATSTLGMLRSLGVAIALDDFGKTGVSLTALRHLPITHVKLDHELAPDFARAHGVAAAATTLCRTLGLRVIAEGIETKAQLEGARAAGVDAVQGFAVAGMLASHEVSPYLPGFRPGVVSRPPV